MDWKNVIAEAQARNGLTQPQLAEIAGCTQPTISSLASGKTLDPRYSIGSKLVQLAASKPRKQPSTQES